MLCSYSLPVIFPLFPSLTFYMFWILTIPRRTSITVPAKDTRVVTAHAAKFTIVFQFYSTRPTPKIAYGTFTPRAIEGKEGGRVTGRYYSWPAGGEFSSSHLTQ